MDEEKLKSFVDVMVLRGLGLYGLTEMAKICYDSGIALTDTREIDHEKCVEQLLINYGIRNLPAKMTAIVLARKNNIPVPAKLLEKKNKSRRRFFRRRK